MKKLNKEEIIAAVKALGRNNKKDIMQHIAKVIYADEKYSPEEFFKHAEYRDFRAIMANALANAIVQSI